MFYQVITFWKRNFVPFHYPDVQLTNTLILAYLTTCFQIQIGRLKKNSTDSHQSIRAEQNLTSAKTGEWHCMCRYIRWALVFYNGDVTVTNPCKTRFLVPALILLILKHLLIIACTSSNTIFRNPSVPPYYTQLPLEAKHNKESPNAYYCIWQGLCTSRFAPSLISAWALTHSSKERKC